MYYYLYEVKNNITNKIYVGVHRTNNLDDGYMGSGKVIRTTIKKYGLENFTKTVIEYFSTDTEMYQREKEVVTEEFVKRKDVYNIRCGGYGGFDHINDGGEEHINRVRRGGYASSKLSRDKKIGIYAPDYISPFTDNRERQQMGNLPEARKKAVTEAKETFKEIGHQQGEKHSQYGTCWVMNIDLKINKKIKKEELDFWIKQGYVKGRRCHKEF